MNFKRDFGCGIKKAYVLWGLKSFISNSDSKHRFLSLLHSCSSTHGDLGGPTHTLVPCWVPKPLLPCWVPKLLLASKKRVYELFCPIPHWDQRLVHNIGRVFISYGFSFWGFLCNEVSEENCNTLHPMRLLWAKWISLLIAVAYKKRWVYERDSFCCQGVATGPSVDMLLKNHHLVLESETNLYTHQEDQTNMMETKLLEL